MAKTNPPNKKKLGPFAKPANITREYERSLRKVASEVGRIIEAFQTKVGITLPSIHTAQKTLEDYAKILKPWAQLKGQQLAEASDLADRRAWAKATAEMGRGIKLELRGNTRVGRTMREIMERQVHYITSLPIEAGERVHKLVIEGLSDSTRAEEIAKDIANSGEVTKSRAMLIARTETTRAATALTQARALDIGSETYIWRTVHDGRVRELHRELDGQTFRWDSPPIAGEHGERAHPGEIYNCRCRPEPIIPSQ